MFITRIGENHTIVNVKGGGRYLQSYESCVAHIDISGHVTLGSRWNISPTTTRHVAKMLDVAAIDIKKRIKTGVFSYNARLQEEFDNA